MKGLYVHVPFCRQRCIYCDFCSNTNRGDKIVLYFECLKSEFKRFCDKSKNKSEEPFDTIYIGGGTPTFVSPELIADFLNFVKDNSVVNKQAEISIEGNPDSISPNSMKILAGCGINRLSIGLQTSNDEMLAFLNRPHKLSDFISAVKAAKDAGIQNISADIILGLPFENDERLGKTVETILNARLKHVSAYGLSVERGTVLSKMVSTNRRENSIGMPIGFFGLNNISNSHAIAMPDEDETADFYDTVYGTLAKHGFKRYEVSNFAHENFECRHNLNYWRCGEYLGIGASAHSYLNGVRYSNIKNLDKYIDRIMSKKDAVVTSERLTKKDKAYEFLILGLRTDCGINLEDFKTRFGFSFEDVYGAAAKKLIGQGFLNLNDNRLKVPDNKFYVLNSILSEF